MNIGWIGLGNMGVPMATNLIRAGHALTVTNRTKEKAQPVLDLGARWADTPAELWRTCDLVITMVSDDDAVKQVYTGKDGLLAVPVGAGKIAVDMSTVSPGTSRFLAERCRAAGIRFLDAPVSGSVQPAREGKLIIMAGGDADTFAAAKPVFDALGKMALHLGGHGAGSEAKLAINLLLGITVQGIAEAVLFARERGIRPEDMMTIINESAVGTAISRLKTESILAGSYPAAFALKHMAKDLRLAKAEGAASPLALSAHDTYQAALREGRGEEDVMAVLAHLAERLAVPSR